MNTEESYKEWISIFDEELAKVWNSFIDKKELRKVSMILFAVKKEFHKVTVELDQEVAHLKKKISHRNHLQNKDTFPLSLSKNHTKCRDNVSFLEALDRTETTIGSPDLFGSPVKKKSSESEENTTVILSDGDDTNLEHSPIIKRKRKVSRIKDFSNNTPSLHFDLNFLNNSNVEENNMDTTNSKAAIMHNILNDTPALSKDKIQQSDQFKTPVPRPVPNLLESSVIANTPEVAPKRNKGNLSKGSVLFLSKKKSFRKDNNSTLTQMFSEIGKSKSKKRGKQSHTKSNAENVEPEIPIDITNMSISQMVNFINDPDDDDETKISIMTGHSENVDVLEKGICSSLKITDAAKSSSTTDPQQISDLTLSNDPFEDGLNEYLAKANNIQDNAISGPVVRGKARKNLPSWSCKECERFYMHQDLSLEELKRLTKICSKHKGSTKPREDTLPGVWDITMTTQKSQQ